MSVPEDPNDDGGWAAMPKWLARDKSFSSTEKMIYLLLSCRTKRDGIEAWPSQGLLAEELGVSVNTAQRAIHRLRDAGIVSIKVIKTSRGRHNVYYLEVHPFGGKRPPLDGDPSPHE